MLITAQRRMGKTSLMRELARKLSNEGEFYCFYIDLEGSSSAADAIAKLSASTRAHQPVWGKVKGAFANALSFFKDQLESLSIADVEIALRAGITNNDWQDKGDKLFEILANTDKKTLILLDEVPVMISRMLRGIDGTITPESRAQTDTFLTWLRANCQKHVRRVHLILTGSIGLEPVLRQGQLSATINHLEAFGLEPWDTATASSCLQALGRQYGIDFAPGTLDSIVDHLGSCIPHHVQLFFARLEDRCMRSKSTQVTLADVEHAYKEGMLGNAGHAELSHYEERLRLALTKDDYTLALDMLTEAAVTRSLSPAALEYFRRDEAARNPSPENQRQVLERQRNLIWILEHDGYLKRKGEGYVFISKLLRDWWKARHGGFYTQVSKRSGQ